MTRHIMDCWLKADTAIVTAASIAPVAIAVIGCYIIAVDRHHCVVVPAFEIFAMLYA